MHASNPNTQEMGVGDSELSSQPRIHETLFQQKKNMSKRRKVMKDYWIIGTNSWTPNMSLLFTSQSGDLQSVPGTRSVVIFPMRESVFGRCTKQVADSPYWVPDL